ncbi:hypothetical protein J6W34_08800 [bacterium]|nr:hypothetical protein [bacterium]
MNYSSSFKKIILMDGIKFPIFALIDDITVVFPQIVSYGNYVQGFYDNATINFTLDNYAICLNNNNNVFYFKSGNPMIGESQIIND